MKTGETEKRSNKLPNELGQMGDRREIFADSHKRNLTKVRNLWRTIIFHFGRKMAYSKKKKKYQPYFPLLYIICVMKHVHIENSLGNKLETHASSETGYI